MRFITPADKLVGLGSKFGLEWCHVPRAARHEVMQLVVVSRRHPGSHRLQALALAGADQSGQLERAHAPMGWVTKRFEE